MSTTRAPLILATRFSVFSPTAGGLRIRQEFGQDIEEFERVLFDPSRLDTRLDILTNLAVPRHARFAEHMDLVQLVQYSSNLPEKYIDALHKTSEKYSFFKPVLVNDSTMFDSVLDYLRELGPSFRGVFAWARVDDDDILSESYFRVIQNYLSEHFVGMAISFPVQAATLYSNGLITNVRKDFVRNPSAGQTFVGRYNGLYNTAEVTGLVPHHEVDKIVPTIVDPTVVGSLQMLHSTQDTSSFTTPVGGRLINRASQLGGYSEMSAKSVASDFPSLLDRSRIGNALHGAQVIVLEPGIATNAPALKEGKAYRLDFNVESDSKVADGYSIGFEFAEKKLADGHFPWTEARSHYLRLHADSLNSGSEFFVVPHGAKLKTLKINVDRPGLPASRVRISVCESGPLENA